MRYFYAQKGQQHGPVSFEELKRLADRDEIKRRDRVWCKGMTPWQPAASVAGLFDDLPPDLKPDLASDVPPPLRVEDPRERSRPRNDSKLPPPPTVDHAASRDSTTMADVATAQTGPKPPSSKVGRKFVYFSAALVALLSGAVALAWPTIKQKLIESAVACARSGAADQLSWRIAVIGDPHMVNRLLREACSYERSENVTFLLARGGDPNAATDGGLSPLVIVLSNVVLQGSTPERMGIFRTLLDAGANPNVTDVEGNTPLHLLANSCSPAALEIAHLLLQKGACVDVTNKLGLTPLSFALSNCVSIVPPLSPGTGKLVGRWLCSNNDGLLTFKVSPADGDQSLHVFAERDSKYVPGASAEVSFEGSKLRLVVQLTESMEMEKQGAVYGSYAVDQALGIRPSPTPGPVRVTSQYDLIYEVRGDRLSGACSGSKYSGPVSFQRVGPELDPYQYNNNYYFNGGK